MNGAVPGGSWGSLGSVHGVVNSVFLPWQVLTTIEGIIDRAVAGLEQDQPARRVRLERETPQGWGVLGVSIPCPLGTQGCWGQLCLCHSHLCQQLWAVPSD